LVLDSQEALGHGAVMVKMVDRTYHVVQVKLLLQSPEYVVLRWLEFRAHHLQMVPVILDLSSDLLQLDQIQWTIVGLVVVKMEDLQVRPVLRVTMLHLLQ
jgi:hypothetical protein